MTMRTSKGSNVKIFGGVWVGQESGENELYEMVYCTRFKG